MKPTISVSRILALFLILALSLPNPAFALRQINAGMEESPVNQELRNRFGITAGVKESRAAGMEELVKLLTDI